MLPSSWPGIVPFGTFSFFPSFPSSRCFPVASEGKKLPYETYSCESLWSLIVLQENHYLPTHFIDSWGTVRIFHSFQVIFGEFCKLVSFGRETVLLMHFFSFHRWCTFSLFVVLIYHKHMFATASICDRKEADDGGCKVNAWTRDLKRWRVDWTHDPLEEDKCSLKVRLTSKEDRVRSLKGKPGSKFDSGLVV